MTPVGKIRLDPAGGRQGPQHAITRQGCLLHPRRLIFDHLHQNGQLT